MIIDGSTTKQIYLSQIYIYFAHQYFINYTNFIMHALAIKCIEPEKVVNKIPKNKKSLNYHILLYLIELLFCLTIELSIK